MPKTHGKDRAPRNRTLTIDESEVNRLSTNLKTSLPKRRLSKPIEGIVQGDCQHWSRVLPRSHVDLLILDPPYNLDKFFNGEKFSKTSTNQYTDYLEGILTQLLPLLKPTATIYVCGDWLTSHSIFEVASQHLRVRNRITWEREKGRGAKTNWKNSSEDIWFCTRSDDYYFDTETVKIRKKVIAPYTTEEGDPKDWSKTKAGNFRDTHASNLWTDISIPFWSMPENTDHPTQKSEKLLAKLILASSQKGDFVLDPFLGSGTTTAVSEKLGRRSLGIEKDSEFCLLAQKRLELARQDTSIQGYDDGVFWERNSIAFQKQVLGNRSHIP
ncbi:MAG: site-specific DNA-methyltransferase [Planctomycetota bacterium]|nr:site-specific DNA-methyltransferase [Planctomycetota bacterium]